MEIFRCDKCLEDIEDGHTMRVIVDDKLLSDLQDNIDDRIVANTVITTVHICKKCFTFCLGWLIEER